MKIFLSTIALLMATAPPIVAAKSEPSATTESDNTRVNQRDRSDKAVTADQQNFNGTDTDITARIRRDIMSIDGLSTYAQNVKIITADGKVTLKGPVKTSREKETILKSARAVAGARNVTDQTTIAP